MMLAAFLFPEPEAFKHKRTMKAPTLSVRVNRKNPDHHLWNNHGTWWLHYTLHMADFTKRRVRKSLGTHDVDEARTRRDELFANLAGKPF